MTESVQSNFIGSFLLTVSIWLCIKLLRTASLFVFAFKPSFSSHFLFYSVVDYSRCFLNFSFTLTAFCVALPLSQFIDSDPIEGIYEVDKLNLVRRRPSSVLIGERFKDLDPQSFSSLSKAFFGEFVESRLQVSNDRLIFFSYYGNSFQLNFLTTSIFGSKSSTHLDIN